MSQVYAPEDIPNGRGADAILAAGIGCAAVGILALARDAFTPVAHALNFYNPAGPLSGVTTVAVLIWLIAWFILAGRWRDRTVAVAKVNVAAFIFLAIGLLLTFPPVMDFLQGK